MAKMRSPNYPAVGLGEAVEMTRTLWGKEKRTPVTEDVASKALGYSSLSGPARSRLAALKKYGLIENVSGNVRISDLGMKLVHPANATELLDASREAALTPELFADLYKSHPDASDTALSSYLIRELQFSDIGAKRVIGAFRDTLRFAKLSESGYSPQDETQEHEAMTKTSDVSRQQPVSAGALSYSWPLAKDLRAEIRFIGPEVKPEHIDRLAKYLELAKDALESANED